jgi:intracellular septation protein
MTTKTARIVRIGVDYGVPVVFLATWLLTRDFQKAALVMIVSSAAALVAGWLVERRLAPMPLFAGASALVFGGLSLAFHDKNLIKIKFTFVEGVLAAAMFGGLIVKRNPLKALMGDAVQLPDGAWRTLTVRYGLFFTSCAVANEFIWRTQSDAFWGLFKLGTLGGAIAFSLAQAPFLMKHAIDPKPEVAPEPPDPGF